MERDPEKQFQMVLNVFREYLLDLDSDTEGCGGDELEDIWAKTEAASCLRQRIVAHFREGKDARGQ